MADCLMVTDENGNAYPVGAIEEPVVEIPTGITGLTCYKQGRRVDIYGQMSSISTTGDSWNTIWTLPEELAPRQTVFFTGWNNADSEATLIRQFNIAKNSHSLNVYAKTGESAIIPRFFVSYLI